jgi:hypothetical protein
LGKEEEGEGLTIYNCGFLKGRGRAEMEVRVSSFCPAEFAETRYHSL